MKKFPSPSWGRSRVAPTEKHAGRWHTRRTQLLAASLTAVIVLAATVGVAAATDPTAASGTIYTCINSSTGSLRIVSATQTCQQGEYASSWNHPGLNWKGLWSATATYAAGDSVTLAGSSWVALKAGTDQTPGSQSTYWSEAATTGNTGPEGDTGPTGPAGFPDPPGLYIVQAGSHLPFITIPASSTGNTTVGSMSIQSPGPYAILAKLNIDSATGDTGDANCTLTAGDQSDTANIILTTGYDERSISLEVVNTFAPAGTSQNKVLLQCDPDIGTAEVSNVTITAIRGASLINSPLN